MSPSRLLDEPSEVPDDLLAAVVVAGHACPALLPGRWGRLGGAACGFAPFSTMLRTAFPTRPLEPQVHRTRHPLVKAREELAHEQLHRDIVRPLLDLPLVTEACVPDRSGDVAEPAEPSHPLKGLAVGGVSESLAMTFSNSSSKRRCTAWGRR